MKITAVKPFVLSAGIFVKIETDAGIYGIGEAGMSLRGPAVAEVLNMMAPILVGEDPRRIEHLWQVMFRGGFFPGGGVQTSALSAVDIALWDIKGKALGVPVYELLGGRVRDRVVCYPHNGYPRSIDALVENCRDKQALGWNSRDGALSILRARRAIYSNRRARCALESNRSGLCVKSWVMRSRSASMCIRDSIRRR